ncbi:T9SS type A sorting domain-containing protein [bacterium]|nr:T9SS type A sorting domain-containing protein [bacterium]
MKKGVFFISVLVLYVSMSPAQISYWPLDTDASDAISVYDGVAEPSGVSFVNDAVRGPVMFLDGDGGFVTLPPSLLDGIEDVTITCWFYWLGGGVWQRVYSFGNPMPDVRTLYLCPQDGLNPNQLHITLGGQPPGGVFTWYDYTPVAIQTDTWYFTAYILKGDSLQFYLNDELVVNTGGVLVDPEDLTPDLGNYLGKSHWEDPTFFGMIDDVRFYAEALSPAEVAALYGSATAVKSEKNSVHNFRLNPNYPNPFNPVTYISYETAGSGAVSLKIYDMLGQEVEPLVDETQAAGAYTVVWNGRHCSSGIYLVRLETKTYSETRKMILQK